ncbi:tetratricopeptide repeat protein [Natronospora cellulosivora (SeqCode)]
MKKISYLVILLSLMLFISFFSASAANSQFILEGVNQYYQEDYQEAVKSFNKILSEDESNVNALYYQTLAYLELYNIREARANIQILEDMGYTYALHYWKLGELYLNKKGFFDSPFYNEARRKLERANQLGISSAALHSDLAMAFQGLGNTSKAAEHYEIAVDKGAVIEDHVNLAILYKEAGKLDLALELYYQILEEDENRRSIYLNMGNIYIEQGKYQLAIDILNRGLEIDSTFLAIRTSLAEAYYRNENYEKAKEHFSVVINNNPNIYQAYFYLGEIYNLVEGNHEAAINYYQRAINYNRSYVRAYLALGNLHLQNDEYYRAMAQFMNALESNPNHAEAHYRLALAFYQMGRIESAIEELRTTLHLDSNHNQARLLLNRLREEE